MMNGGWGVMTPFGWVVMVVLWVSVIAVVVWAVTRVFPGGGGAAAPTDAKRPQGEQ